MKSIKLIQLGSGNVGGEVQSQIKQQRTYVQRSLDLDLEYAHTFTSKNTVEEIISAINAITIPFILIDTTAANTTVPYIEKALEKGGSVVMANKKPLSGDINQYNTIYSYGRQKVFFETTVGAGLPVIRTLQDLVATGDEIVEIQGCFSGTLGYLFSELDSGKSFSETVMKAKSMGFTEPDPRDDLSGVDVARKALILSRLIGKEIALSDIELTSLYPDTMQHYTIDEFLKQLTALDEEYKKKIAHASEKQQRLRFVATISAEKTSVGLEEVSASSDIGNLQGPDNIIVFKTKRYFDNPLVVKGPGAGREVTAAGVFADILQAAIIGK